MAVIVVVAMLAIAKKSWSNKVEGVENRQEASIKENKTNKDFSDEEITKLAKSTYEKYIKLDIFQDSTIGPMPYILEVLELETREQLEELIESGTKDTATYIKSHTKYEDFKNEMLKYMTEELFDNKFSQYKNVNGYVAFCNVAPSSIENVKLISRDDPIYQFEITLKDDEVYEHYLNGESIEEQEYLNKIKESFEFINGYFVVSSIGTEEGENHDSVSKNNTQQEKQTEIDWEEYPNNIQKSVEKIVNQFFGTEEEINYIGKGQKMIYSLINNKLYNNRDDSIFKNILYSYTDFAGDYFTDVETETNYNQYDYSSKENTIEKYEDIIKYKTAIFNSSRYDEYTENGTLKTLTEKTKKQYEIIKAENNNKVDEYYYGLDKIVVMNGNNTSKEDYKNNSRAKKIKVTVNGEKEYSFELKDTNKAQVFDLSYEQKSIAKPIDISIEVLESYEGEKTKDIYISDVQFGVTTNISLGI